MRSKSSGGRSTRPIAVVAGVQRVSGIESEGGGEALVVYVYAKSSLPRLGGRT
jgi:hypothetical protein